MITWQMVTGLPFLVCLALTVASVVFLGLVIERFGNRVFVDRGASLFVQSFATIGVSLVIECVVLVAYGHEPLTMKAFSGDKPIMFLGAAISPQSLWIIGMAALMILGSKLFFDYTKFGKAMRAAADNPVGAAVVGITRSRMSQCAFAISAGLAGLMGVAITPLYYAAYDTGVMFTVKGFIAAVLGGMYNPFGAVGGGLLLGFLENFGAGLISSGFKDLIALVVLVVVLLFRGRHRLGLERKQ